MEPMHQYFMLKIENGGMPNAVHATYESARKRATDLARGTRQRVAILSVIEVVTPIVPEAESIEVVFSKPEPPIEPNK